jgi:hypothetical protein
MRYFCLGIELQNKTELKAVILKRACDAGLRIYNRWKRLYQIGAVSKAQKHKFRHALCA